MTIYSQIAANKLKTYLIIGVFIALMTGFFLLLGQYFRDPQSFFFHRLYFCRRKFGRKLFLFGQNCTYDNGRQTGYQGTVF